MVRSFPSYGRGWDFLVSFLGKCLFKSKSHPGRTSADINDRPSRVGAVNKKSTPKNVGANITSGGCFIFFIFFFGSVGQPTSSRGTANIRKVLPSECGAQWASNLWAIKARFFLRFPFPSAADALQLVFPRRPRSGLNYGVKSPLNDRKNDLLLENLAQQLFVAFVFATVNSIIAVIIALLQHKPPGLFGCFWGVTASMDC